MFSPACDCGQSVRPGDSLGIDFLRLVPGPLRDRDTAALRSQGAIKSSERGCVPYRDHPQLVRPSGRFYRRVKERDCVRIIY